MFETLQYDDATGRMVVHTVQDVAPILDANKAAYDHDNRRWGNEPMHHVARIPLVVIEKMRVEKGIDLMKDEDAMKAFLNDPDNKFLRTKPGRL